MPAREAAPRVGIIIFASVFGMSFGGWVSGVIFDATGSYAAAFVNGFAWNVLNLAIMALLLIRSRQRLAMAGGRRTNCLALSIVNGGQLVAGHRLIAHNGEPRRPRRDRLWRQLLQPRAEARD